MKKSVEAYTLEDRKKHIVVKEKNKEQGIKCDQHSISGAVSQRACVYCGARVVLNPITDAVHIIHGPIGCSSYTWDIRGSLSSDSEMYRNSFSTDLQERDIIFGGEKKLAGAIDEIVESMSPQTIFVYSTCVVGVIGDDLDAVCKQAEKKYNIRVIPVKSSGFAGSKKDGYQAACNAIISLMDDKEYKIDIKDHRTLNYLGDFNLAGEVWILNNYFKEIGVNMITGVTGDSTIEKLKKAQNASFNIVQCAGSSIYLAKMMEERFKIPYEQVSFFGIQDTANSLLNVARLTGDKKIIRDTEVFIKQKKADIASILQKYKEKCAGKKVAIYVGGGFKAISLIKQFNELGMTTVMVGTQTGRQEEYDTIKELAEEGTVILDDTNPTELQKFIKEKGADLLVGGVKERPLAYKLGIAFIDHNHERKLPLLGFEGAVNFAKEVDLTVNSPVWNLVREG
ncbi:nitrogenase iron-molybdenum cofactor biosynthesis protein NifE [Alkalibaculum sp. M08DMB]|uniref:Nitrogenase iron-molybdenum cofactor biosynthesis protein NifE n=1 Tax=Alkalibaculum sporogenes TaxID=2655001 RepID=A0A6A7KCC4_9FIRM|nr:nitrogenase iron-molybdenum cofactor biosynthesis protein NifE [Alkalibaculum sporogenes]MPW27046.1 nitrogenase iron-molybdenum cofactor biosynthesis protein NifE [Alkalibaculum sporogenes]